jgi:hypothetical protein
VYSTLLFFPAIQTCCLEAEEDLAYFNMEFLAIITGQLPVELWCLSASMLVRVFDLVFCKTLFCIHFQYGMCGNFIPGHTYYEYLGLA